MLEGLEMIQKSIYEVAEERGKEFRYWNEETQDSNVLKGLCVPATLTVQKILEDLGKKSEVVRATVHQDGELPENHYFLLIPDRYLDIGRDETGNLITKGPLKYFTERRGEPMSIFDPTGDQYTKELFIREMPPKGKSALEYLKGNEETMKRFDGFYNAVFEKLEDMDFMREYRST